MDWTQLTMEPRSVSGIYGGAPPLERFALMDLSASGGEVKIGGDLVRLPDPLPDRWQARGYTRAALHLTLSEVVECEIHGVPGLHFDEARCMIGDPVDLSVAASDRTWTLPDGSERAGVELRGESPHLRFRVLARWLGATIEGYEASPY